MHVPDSLSLVIDSRDIISAAPPFIDTCVIPGDGNMKTDKWLHRGPFFSLSLSVYHRANTTASFACSPSVPRASDLYN